jgi:hypothetical protein
MATSKFIRYFEKVDGSPLHGARIGILTQDDSDINNILELTEDGTRHGLYIRDTVPDNEYKVYIDTTGGEDYVLYMEHVWHGDNRITLIANHFDPSDDYKLHASGIKMQEVIDSIPDATVGARGLMTNTDRATINSLVNDEHSHAHLARLEALSNKLNNNGDYTTTLHVLDGGVVVDGRIYTNSISANDMTIYVNSELYMDGNTIAVLDGEIDVYGDSRVNIYDDQGMYVYDNDNNSTFYGSKSIGGYSDALGHVMYQVGFDGVTSQLLLNDAFGGFNQINGSGYTSWGDGSSFHGYTDSRGSKVWNSDTGNYINLDLSGMALDVNNIADGFRTVVEDRVTRMLKGSHVDVELDSKNRWFKMWNAGGGVAIDIEADGDTSFDCDNINIGASASTALNLFGPFNIHAWNRDNFITVDNYDAKVQIWDVVNIQPAIEIISGDDESHIVMGTGTSTFDMVDHPSEILRTRLEKGELTLANDTGQVSVRFTSGASTSFKMWNYTGDLTYDLESNGDAWIGNLDNFTFDNSVQQLNVNADGVNFGGDFVSFGNEYVSFDSDAHFNGNVMFHNNSYLMKDVRLHEQQDSYTTGSNFTYPDGLLRMVFQTTAGTTMTLPSIYQDGTIITIKNISPGNITVTTDTPGTKKVDGAASITMASMEGKSFIYKDPSWYSF